MSFFTHLTIDRNEALSLGTFDFPDDPYNISIALLKDKY
jgi:hypothetical protein